jgi:hypothetical protein
LQAGDNLPVFAAPLWNSHFANGADVDTGGSKVPPCRFNAPGVMNICQLRKRHLVIAFMVLGNGRCEKQLDTLQKVMPRFPQVNFAAVAIKASRDDLAKEVRKRHWTFPVAYDHDGAVGNLYDVVVCPAVTFADPGGRVFKTSLGSATTDPRVLATEIRTLLRSPTPRPATAGG